MYSGCMKSSKSKALIDLYDSFIGQGKTVEVFQPAMNLRDGARLKSRAYPNRVIECTPLIDPSFILQSKADVLMVDEFFMLATDYFEQFLKDAKKDSREVIIAGLDMMANGREFANYTIAKRYCVEEIKLTADCEFKECEQPATMSYLTSLGSSFIEGNGTVYNVYCKTHWTDLTRQRELNKSK